MRHSFDRDAFFNPVIRRVGLCVYDYRPEDVDESAAFRS